MEEIAYYCKDQNYQLILAVHTQDAEDGQIISAVGDTFNIVLNLVMFAKSIGEYSSCNVLGLVKEFCEMELEKNENHSGGKKMTMPEMFKEHISEEHISEIEEMKDKFRDYLDVWEELDGKFRFSNEEEEIYAVYRAVWEHLVELSCEINSYLKKAKKANANHS